MWPASWSSHHPQGAPSGQQAGTAGTTFPGLHSTGPSVPSMNQPQWTGTSHGLHGHPPGAMTSPVMGPSTFPGQGGHPPPNFQSSMGSPSQGHHGQGFAVQCKHHQGCHSSTQNHPLVMGSPQSGSTPPLGFGQGPQPSGHQGTSWSSYPTTQHTSPQPSQPHPPHQQALQPMDVSLNPTWSSPPQFSQNLPCLSHLNQHQPKQYYQNSNNPQYGQLGQLAQGPQALPVQSSQAPLHLPVRQVMGQQHPPGAQDSQMQASLGQAPAGPNHNPSVVVQAEPSKTTPPPTQGVPATPNLPPAFDIQALEQRLGATLEKSMETMAASLKSSLATTMQAPTPTPSPTPPGTNPVSIQPTPTMPPATPVKAKPPTPPTDSSQQQKTPSRNSLRTPLTRENKSSRRSRSRSRRRRRSKSRDHHKKKYQESASRRVSQTSGQKGQDFSSSKKRPDPDRYSTQQKSSSGAPHPGKDRTHPIYHKSNAFHQVHQDGRSTIYKKGPGDRESLREHTPRSTSPSHAKEPMISLRSRSRTRRTSPNPPRDRPYGFTPGSITLLPGRKTRHAWDPPEASASETPAESQMVEIPQIEMVADWRRPSQERDDEDEQEEPEDPGAQIPIPTHKPMDEDWRISVKKAFDDSTRTLAPCEISASRAIVLPTTTGEKAYKRFASTLQQHNPKAPQTVIGNMTSVFAQSGRMSTEQARGSYTFEIRAMELFGLFVPTNFRSKPPFDGIGANVYHIIHGTSTKGASTILAEEMIRPGDFTINRDYAQCQYPSYGFYSAGEIASKTCKFSSNIEELSRKILKIGKGTLLVHIGGIYTGRHQHSNQQAGGNDEVQRLCGKNGVARGKEKYTVARSEHTTVVGVIVYYKNQIDNP